MVRVGGLGRSHGRRAVGCRGTFACVGSVRTHDNCIERVRTDLPTVTTT